MIMKIVRSFRWRKISSVRREEWCDDMKDGQKLKLGDAHITPRYIQEVQATKLGHPLLHQQKYQVIFQDTIFLLLHMICVILGASVIFALSLFYFLCCSIWLYPSIFVLDRDTLRFHCLEHSSFHSYYSVSVHFLLVLRLALVFQSYYVQSLLVFFSFKWLALWSLMIINYESCFK